MTVAVHIVLSLTGLALYWTSIFGRVGGTGSVTALPRSYLARLGVSMQYTTQMVIYNGQKKKALDVDLAVTWVPLPHHHQPFVVL